MSSELGPDARAILDAAHDAHDPDAATRARVRAAVLRRATAAGAIAATTAAATTTAASTSASIGAGLVVKALVAVALATGGVTAAHRALQPKPATLAVARPAQTVAVVTVTASAPLAVLSVSPPETAAVVPAAPRPMPAPEPVKVRPSPVAPPPSPAALPPTTSTSTGLPPPSSTLGDELLSLKAANRALRENRPTDALAILDAIKGSTLGQERAATRVLALCALGRPEARATAEQFVTDHPSSPYLPRIRKACAIP